MFYGVAYITNNGYNLPCFFSKNPVIFCIPCPVFLGTFSCFFNTDPVGTLLLICILYTPSKTISVIICG